jgi:hypothetical protein
LRKDGSMAKHLLNETAEFAMPRPGRHTAPETGELEITQRFEAADHPRAARRLQLDEFLKGR